ncbi:hypothetical protein OE88DRAFT_1650119 [Heliocybe sulcata]|uniref:Uncharacterized protein n=1 Tax=Heliocybe sulcata TaxID=5364 RepID=A0A5C3NJP3_9AGAM|nr:hypothetical protein OE88DRAFT_1650119 [Heliocybe sulcata]
MGYVAWSEHVYFIDLEDSKVQVNQVFYPQEVNSTIRTGILQYCAGLVDELQCMAS